MLARIMLQRPVVVYFSKGGKERRRLDARGFGSVQVCCVIEPSQTLLAGLSPYPLIRG